MTERSLLPTTTFFNKIKYPQMSMRSLMTVLLVLTLCGAANAQTVMSSYVQAKTTGATFLNPGTTTTLFAAGSWSGSTAAPAAVTIPFSFNFLGSNYSTCYVNPNGYVTFGATSDGINYTPLSLHDAGVTGIVAGLATGPLSGTTPPKYGVTGTAPNRVFSIIWTSAVPAALANSAITFEINLYETTNKAEVIYSTSSLGTTAATVNAQVGIGGASNTDYLNWTETATSTTTTAGGSTGANWVLIKPGTANNATCTMLRTNALYFPASGLSFSWTPSLLLYSPSGINNTGFTMNWQPAAGATSYSVELSTSNVFASYVSGYPTSVASTDTFKVVTGLATGTKYYYRVKPVYASTGMLSISTTYPITIPVAAPLSLTPASYTYDIIANGANTPVGSTSFNGSTNNFITYNGLDHGGWDLACADFYNIAATNGLPVGGSLTENTSNGIVYQLAPYFRNNVLWFASGSGTSAGAMTFATPVALSTIYVAALSGAGANTLTYTVNFADGGATQVFSGQAVNDWCSGASAIIATITRANTNESVANCPFFYKNTLALSAANVSRLVSSVTVQCTGATTTYPAIVAISGQRTGILTPSVTTLTAFASASCSAASTSQSFTLTGSNLANTTANATGTGNILVTAPLGFKVSSDNITFVKTLNVAFTNCSIATTTLYTRLDTNVVGNFTGTITFSGGSVPSILLPTVTVSGTVAGVGLKPAATVSYPATRGTINFGIVTVGTTSGALVDSLQGFGLTGNVSITSTNPDFQYSLDGVTYGSSVTVTVAGSTISPSIPFYTKVTPTINGANVATITMSGGTPACTYTFKDSVYGAPACVSPSLATTLTFTGTNATSTSVGYTAGGTQDGYLVVRSTSPFVPGSDPVSGNNYAVNASFGNGNVIAISNAAPPYAATGLTGNTTYYYTIVPFNGGTVGGTCGSGPLYPTGTQLTGSVVTCPAATGTPTSASITGSSFTANWSAPAGGSASAITYLVDVSTNNTFTAPITGSPFATSALTLNLTGLLSGTAHYVRVTAVGACNSTVSGTLTVTTIENYTPLTIASGFNADIVANGSTAPQLNTSWPVPGITSFDNAGFDLVGTPYTFATTTYRLPAGGAFSSFSTSGLTYQLANYASTNALLLHSGLSYPTTGTLTFPTPVKASTVYIAGISGTSTTTVTYRMNFTDGTTETSSTFTYPDWYATTITAPMGFALKGVGRVSSSNTPTNGEGTATTPSLFQALYNVSTAGQSKTIQSITATWSSGTGYLGIMGVSIKSGTMAASVSSVPAFTTAGCTNSSSQTFTISGAALFPSGGAITAKASAGFQVSNNGSSWDTVAAISYTGNAMSGATVYVRFTPGAPGVYTGNITFSGGTVNTTPTVSVSGTATGFVFTPVTTAAFGPISTGTSSAGMRYTMSGTSLAAGTITITSSNSVFEVSADSVTWNSSFNFVNGSTLSAPLFIRFSPVVNGLQTSSISVASTSETCLPSAISATGTGATPCLVPSLPTTLTFSATTASATSIGFTPSGSADAYIVVKSYTPFVAGSDPVTTYAYAVNDTFGNGRVVAVNTTAPPYALMGMNANSTYYYTVVPLNGGVSGSCSGGPLYPAGTQLSGAVVTCPGTPTSLTSSNITGSSFGLSWAAPAGGSASTITYSVEVSTNSGFTAPVTGSPFAVSGTSTTITGLNTITQYYYRVSAVGACTSTPSATGSITTTENYIPVAISGGFNADAIANGSVAPAASTSYPTGSTSFDNAGFDLLGFPYSYYTGTTTYALPATGILSSIATSGLKFQLANYTGNNALYIHSGLGLPTTGTLTFATPMGASVIYVAGISGTSSTSVTYTLNYTDGTSETYPLTYTYADWYQPAGTNTALAYQGVGRIGHGAGTGTAPEGTATTPAISQAAITLSTAGQGKKIQSITANYASGTGYLGIVGVSIKGGVLNSSATTLTAFTGTSVGCTSATQTFTINGSTLAPAAGNIIVKAPTGFQVSNNGSSWDTTANIAYTGGALSPATVYVRFVPTLAGTSSGNITFVGGAVAIAPTVAVTGTTSGLGYSPTSVAAFGPVTVGVTSPAITYALAGTGLTSGTITVTSSNPDFEVSSDSATWAASYNFANGATVASNIYIRFTPGSSGPATSSISITGAAVTCPLPAISATGNGTAACIAPSVPTTLTFSSTTTLSTSVSFTSAGTPDGYLLVKSFAAFVPGSDPVDAHAYATGDTIGNGRIVGVYTVAPPYAATTLSPNTTYFYTVIPYNGGLVGGTCGGGPLYPSGTQLSGSVTTCPAAPTMGTNSVTITSITLNWLSAAGGGALPVTYTVEVYTDAGYTTPVSGSPFTVSSPATSLTVTGLAGGTPYYYRIKSTTSACTSGYTTGTITSGAYCVPTWTAGCTSWRIYSVTMGTVTYTGTCGSSFNQTALIDTVVAAVPAPHTIVAGSYTGIAVWVDFNNNGSFADAGEYLHGSYADGTPATFNINLTVPGTVTTGLYRMRVLCSWGGGIDPTTGSCAAYTGAGGGNYYDFTMYVKNPVLTSSVSTLTDFGSVLRGCSSTSQNFTITGSGLIPASGSVVAHAPAGFEVSTDNATWDTTATYTYTGSNLATSTVYTRFSPSVAGVATGTVTFTGGASLTPPAVSVSGTGTQLTVPVSGAASIFCSAGSAVALTASGATTYSWSPSAGLSATTGAVVNASPTATTIYTVTGADAAGCSFTSNAVTVVYNVSTGPVTGPSSVLCLPGAMALTEAGTGGSWSTSDAGIATVDGGGIVYGVAPSASPVTITYNNATCGGSATYNITVASGGFTVTTSPSSGTYCSTGSPLNITAMGATNYSWSPSAGLDATTGSVVNASPSATTVYTVIGTTGGCSNTTTITVWNTTPGAIEGGVTSLCPTITNTTTWTDTTAGGTWSISAGGIATINSGGVITALAAGTATVTYTKVGCCVTRGLTVNPLPTLAATPATAMVCGGVSATLTATGAATYSWTPSAGLSATVGSTVTATPAVSTTYSITGTTSLGCAAMITKFVGVGPGVYAVASVGTASVCPGGSTTLGSSATTTSGTTYGVNSIPFSLVTQTSPTTVFATGNDDAVTSVALPFAFNFFGVNYAAGSNCTVSTNGYFQFGSGIAGTFYGYANMPSGTFGNNIISLFGRDLQTTNTSGTGSIKASVEGTAPNRKYVLYYNNVSVYCSGCGTPSYNGQIVLNETTNAIDLIVEKTANSSHTIAAMQQNSTTGIAAPARNYVTMQITTPEAWRFAPVLTGGTYAWSPATGLSSSVVAGPTATVDVATVYTVTVTHPGSGCFDTAITSAGVYTPPTVTIPTPTIGCAGTAMTAAGATTYAWSPSTGLSATSGATVTPNAAVASTTYSVIGTDTRGCKDTATLVVNPVPVLSVTPGAVICNGASASLTASGADTYSWTNSSSLDASTNATVTATPATSTTYSVSGFSLAGCASLVSPGRTISVNATPVAGTLTAASGYCLGSGSPYSISTGTATGTGTISSYNWSGPAAFSTTTASPSVSFTPATTAATGVYSLTVTYPGLGCVSAPVTTGTVTVADYPVAQNLTGGSGCTATGITLGLDASQNADYTYSLKRGTTVIATMTGTTTSLSYAPVTAAGTYSVVATGPAGCQTNMSGVSVVNTTPSATIGAVPSICQPTTTAPIALTSIVGSPTTYSVAWDATALAGGFSDISAATFSGASVTLNYNPAGSPGSFDGTLTLSNGSCTSAPYPVHTIVRADPVITSVTTVTPCVGHSGGSIEFTGTDSATVVYSRDGVGTSSFTFSGTTYSLSTGIINSAHTYLIIDVHNPVCTTSTGPIVGSTITVTPTPMAWVGGTVGHEAEWDNVTNWTCGMVPIASDDVLITSAVSGFEPVIPTSFAATTRDLTINSGGVLVIDGGGQLDVKGSYNNSNHVYGNGKVVLNGTSAQNITGTGTTNNLELDNTNGATINTGSRMVITNTLYVTAGTLTTNDSLELASTDTINTARIAALPSSGASISGKVRVDQFVMGGYRRYRFVSHPFSDTMSLGQIQTYIDITGTGGSANGFVTTGSNSPSAFRLDPYMSNSAAGFDPGWRPFTRINSSAADSNKLHPGQGIRLFFRGAKGEGLVYLGWFGMYTPSSTTFKMSGNVNQGAVSVPLAVGSVTPANQDFNMVGNPYPSPVDMGTILWNAREAGQITGSAFYVFDPAISFGGNFVTVNLGLPASSAGAPIPYYVQAHTAVQVRADHDGASIAFAESNKSATTSNYLFKAPVQYTTLNVYDEKYHVYDMLKLDFNDQASDNEDSRLDAVKPMGSSDFNFYSISGDKRNMAIDSRPFAAEKVIPLGITSGYQQNFIIRADNVVVPAGGKLMLHDKLLEKYVEMKAGTEYAFTIGKDKATQGTERFELALKSSIAAPVKGLAVSMTPNPTTDDVKISFTSGRKEKVTVRVMDISGVSIYTQDLGEQQNGTISVPLSSFAAGIYMVELTQGEQKVTQRLVKE